MDLSALLGVVDPIKFIVTVLSLGFAIDSVLRLIARKVRGYRLRKIRAVLGIREREQVVLICSELDDPEIRQMVEEREYIYHMKYGDLDAWIDVLLSFMRLYPNNKIRLMSSREALTSIVEVDANIVVIGGPDYNKIAKYYIDHCGARISYDLVDGEIALQVSGLPKRYYCTDEFHDYGYIERIPNPADPSKTILLFGGCHTLGVTSAVKLLSAFVSNSTEVSSRSLRTAAQIFERVGRKSDRFAFLVSAQRMGSSIAQPGAEDIRWVDAIDELKAPLPTASPSH